jgi:hypothetical protein
MTTKVYIPGSELTPGELNDIQDGYSIPGYEQWRTIGSCTMLEFNSTSAALPKYGSPSPFRQNDQSSGGFRRAARLDPADWSNSYNGVLRTRQLRLVAIIDTDTVFPIEERINQISLRSLSSSATVNTWTLGSQLGTITVPTLLLYPHTYRFEGNPFTFPANAMYTIEETCRVNAVSRFSTGCLINILLQTRAI